MSAAKRRPVVASTASVLDEIYSNDAVSDAAPPRVQQTSPTPATPGGDPSPSRRTRVTHTSDIAPTTSGPDNASAARGRGRGGTRTPAGKKRHSLYVDDEVAAELNGAAEQIGRQLGGMVPKHRVLAALIRAGVNQATIVTAQLRAELLNALQ